MQKFLEDYNQRLKNIKLQKQSWVTLSIIFVVLLISVIIEWGDITQVNNPYLWVFIFAILILTSIIWWFWTMRIMSTFLNHRKQEIMILEEIVIDIKQMKSDIEKLKKP